MRGKPLTYVRLTEHLFYLIYSDRFVSEGSARPAFRNLGWWSNALCSACKDAPTTVPMWRIAFDEVPETHDIV